MLGLLGKKKGMTQYFDENGDAIPVTVVQAGPCVVVQVKTQDNDGYDAVQVGFEEVRKTQRVTKALKGHFAKAKVAPYRYLGEFRLESASPFEVGHTWSVAGFQKGDMVDVTGVTKGKGFQGVIKRHGMAGGPASHGSHFHRTSGSIGMRTFPGRTLKNTRMAGRMGSDTCTVQKLQVIAVDVDNNVLFVKGAIPGSVNGMVVIRNRAADMADRYIKLAGTPATQEQADAQPAS